MTPSSIQPHTYVVLRLPSGMLKTVELIPNTTISIGKFGSFPTNLLLGRPYHLTFEILDAEDGISRTKLRVVPAPELHAENLASDDADEQREKKTDSEKDGVEFDLVGGDGELLMRSNRLTVDDPTRQSLSMEEIEQLKR
ncbi:hypothetical protein LTS18_011284, partial [Coniosporium uncinatum]